MTFPFREYLMWLTRYDILWECFLLHTFELRDTPCREKMMKQRSVEG